MAARVSRPFGTCANVDDGGLADARAVPTPPASSSSDSRSVSRSTLEAALDWECRGEASPRRGVAVLAGASAPAQGATSLVPRVERRGGMAWRCRGVGVGRFWAAGWESGERVGTA